MIQSGRATFTVLSETTDPDVVTQLLGIAPSEVWRKGELLRSGRVRKHHGWFINVGTLDNTELDQTGTRALRELLDRCAAAPGQVADLPEDCEARIWWSASSDSPQGGFVFPHELAAQIGHLGVDLYGTVYLSEDYESDD
jgi:hypothetical protein